KRGLPTLKQLENSNAYFPYRYGQSFLAYVGGRFGIQAVTQIFKTAVADRTGPEAAIQKVLGLSPDTLVSEWHAALKAYYWPMRSKTDSASVYGKVLFKNNNGYNHYNVSPALSPNGKRLLFLSQRDPFSMDLYLADTETGKIIRRLTTSALDPHYSSLQFIQSAGSFSPDGQEVAFSAISAGEPVITIVDTNTGDKVKELRLAQLGAAFNPTWSPDGKQIAFVANEGGFLNLWVINAAGGDLRQITHDQYAELHPDWSPDGKWIAIATDRFSTQLSDLQPGRFDLAVISPTTGEVHRVETFEGSNNINPHWGPDGRTLYFISDVGGVPNLYRLDPGAPNPVPLTDLYVGVSGITELSPALAVASKSGTIVFNAYEKGNFELYRLDHRDVVKDGGAPARASQYDAARLPPLQRSDTMLLNFLSDPTEGLPNASTFTEHPYEGDLSLDYNSQPSLGFGASSFGSFIGGGAGLHFSDMLGRRQLATQLQMQIINGHVLDGIGAVAQYINLGHRTNWGIIGGQMPQVYQSFYGGYADVNGDGRTDFVQQTLWFWEVDRQLVGLLQYPFSRALRLQFSGGYTYTGFTVEQQNQAFDLTTGKRILNQTAHVPACGDSLNFYSTICQPGSLSEGTGAAALVYDNSLMGPTGPVAGARFHIEAAPSFGTLNYMTAVADFREYKRFPGNLTLAGRLMTYGNYGPGSNDFRLSRIFLGYPSLIRGYDYGSFNPNACPSGQALSQCSEYRVLQDLFGTRIAVGNAELRVPLLGPLGLVTKSGNAPPADLVAFYDAGVAWTANSQATFLGGPRPILTSAGVGLRVNLFGFLLGELDYVDPFQRSLKGPYIS
ncbi:MAG: DPP IV N-terminal domain-containing protein, partial [Gemmatimonadota bacterium]